MAYDILTLMTPPKRFLEGAEVDAAKAAGKASVAQAKADAKANIDTAKANEKAKAEKLKASISSLKTKTNTAMSNWNNYYKTANLGKYGKEVQKLSTKIANNHKTLIITIVVVLLIALVIAGAVGITKAIRHAMAIKSGDMGKIRQVEQELSGESSPAQPASVEASDPNAVSAENPANPENPADPNAPVESDPNAVSAENPADPTADANANANANSAPKELSPDERETYINDVISGKYGVGQDRIAALKAKGLTDAQVKDIQGGVNQKVPAIVASKEKAPDNASVESVAKAATNQNSEAVKQQILKNPTVAADLGKSAETDGNNPLADLAASVKNGQARALDVPGTGTGDIIVDANGQVTWVDNKKNPTKSEPWGAMTTNAQGIQTVSHNGINYMVKGNSITPITKVDAAASKNNVANYKISNGVSSSLNLGAIPTDSVTVQNNQYAIGLDDGRNLVRSSNGYAIIQDGKVVDTIKNGKSMNGQPIPPDFKAKTNKIWTQMNNDQRAFEHRR